MPQIKLDDYYKFKKNPGEGLCRVKHCCNQVPPGRNMCYKHTKRIFRARHPKLDAFHNCRNKARQRNIPWDITIEDFRKLCEATRYHDAKGQERFCLTLDRKDELKGYTIDNVQVITRSENTAKNNRLRHLPEHIQSMLKRKREPECPF